MTIKNNSEYISEISKSVWKCQVIAPTEGIRQGVPSTRTGHSKSTIAQCGTSCGRHGRLPRRQSDGDVVIWCSRPDRWPLIGISARSHVHNRKPVNRVCTGCVEGSATNGGRRATAWCGREAVLRLWDVQPHSWQTEVDPAHSVAVRRRRRCSNPVWT